MSSSILKYISEEKDIARYKLALLRKGEKKNYKARLMAIEEEFLDYPFERIGASSTEELRGAMSLFRSDRHLFYERYERKINSKKRVITESSISQLNAKVSII
jgi:hypothetical protein